MDELAFRTPRPRGAVLWLLCAIACLWVMFAVAHNWTGAPGADWLFALLAGDSRAVLHGQLWRLLTAALLHDPGEPWHAAMVGLVLYFFAAPLEQAWGARRLLGFLAGVSAIAFALESLAWLAGIGSPAWYGGMAMVDAVTVAWALANRHATIRLFLLFPMRPMMMVALLAAWHILALIARHPGTEGMIAPFGAMLAGGLLGGGSVRRFWLKARMGRIQRELKGLRSASARRRAGPDLRVIRGGSDDDEPDRRILH